MLRCTKQQLLSEHHTQFELEYYYGWFQVIKIVTVSRQPRVVARFEQHGTKKLISIPITFSDSMCVIKNGKGRSTILDIYVLDITRAEVCSSVAMLNKFKRMCHNNY